MRFSSTIALGLLVGCLPPDTRPPPAEVLVDLRAASTTLDGVTTADGWRVRFDRVLVTVGSAGLRGDACDEYSGSGYTRVLDGRLAKSQKVGLMYGLGTCKFQFRARNPETDSLLGEGITETDRNVLRIPGTDPFETDKGTTYFVRGSAEKAGVRKTFEWSFRRPRLAYDDCKTDAAASPEFTLSEDGARTIELEVHAEALFLDGLDLGTAQLRFEPFAAADDGDGAITLDELSKRSLVDAGITLVDAPAGWKTLADLLYQGSFPKIVRVGARGSCDVKLRDQGGPPR